MEDEIARIKALAEYRATSPWQTITRLFVNEVHYGIFGEMIVFEKSITGNEEFVGSIVRYLWDRKLKMWDTVEYTFVTRQMYDLMTEVINERGY